MSLSSKFQALTLTPEYQSGASQMPIVQELARRYRDEQPFRDVAVATGHVLVYNSLPCVQALILGGAEITLCDPFPSTSTVRVRNQLNQFHIPVHTIQEAVERADLYLDVTAVLARLRLPRGAAELSRSGDVFYQNKDCVTVTVDGAPVKKIETWFGLGDGMLRAWELLKPQTPIQGMDVMMFGYGKVGRGVAHRLRDAGARVVVAEQPGPAHHQACEDGFAVIRSQDDLNMEQHLKRVQVFVAATGIPNAVAQTLPVQWLKREGLTLVTLGAFDEYGPEIEDARVLGGKGKPLNFHLESPTANHYVDPVLAAHLLALEDVVRMGSQLGPGLHPLRPERHQWVLNRWRAHWPLEDLDAALRQ